MHFLHVIVMSMNYILLMQDHYILLCCINFSLCHYLPSPFWSPSFSLSRFFVLDCWLDHQLVHTEQIHILMQDHPALKWLGHFFLKYFFPSHSTRNPSGKNLVFLFFFLFRFTFFISMGSLSSFIELFNSE